MKTQLLAWLLILVCAAAYSQETDVEGSVESPYFTRMPGYVITQSGDKEFAEYTFFDGKKIVSVEGKLSVNTFALPEGTSKRTSMLQIRRNYIAAIKSAGGTVLFEGQHNEFDDTRANSVLVTGKFTKGGKEVWVEVWPYENGGPPEYVLTVVEKESMTQQVSATDMLAALDAEGFIALDVHFETGKAEISEDSKGLIGEIVKLMQDAPALKLAIEGHTDNAGDAKSNKALSEKRARSVLAALTARGIAPTRLSAAGFGQERPVADNRTEEGRAKNRRVELVKR